MTSSPDGGSGPASGVYLHLPASALEALRVQLPQPSAAPRLALAASTSLDVTRLFLGLKDLVEPTGLSYMTLYRAATLGELPAIRLRDRLLVPARALETAFASAASDAASRTRVAWSLRETAPLFGVSTMTMYRVAEAGEFPTVRMRSRILVPVKAVNELIESAMTAGALVDVAEWTAEWRGLGTPEGVA